MRKKKYSELQKRIEREKKLQQVELAMEDKLLLKVWSFFYWITIGMFCFFIESKTRGWWGWLLVGYWTGKEKSESDTEKKMKNILGFVYSNKHFVLFCFRWV